jgi:hypothetical protein
MRSGQLCVSLSVGAALTMGASVPAAAQQVFAAINWGGFSAGPRAQDYPAPQDNMDLYVIEDFQITRSWYVHQFSVVGSGIGGATDVPAVILTDLPPTGVTVISSTPGAGHFVQPPPPQWGTYVTDFGGQLLRPGSYRIMWTVQAPASATPVMFVTSGPHSVGLGVPNNAYQYNPGLGWNFPHGQLEQVTSGFNHTGDPIGVNFVLRGNPAPFCNPDFNNDGDERTDADIEAFFACVAGNCCATCDVADFDGDGSSGTDADIEAFFRVLGGGTC